MSEFSPYKILELISIIATTSPPIFPSNKILLVHVAYIDTKLN